LKLEGLEQYKTLYLKQEKDDKRQEVDLIKKKKILGNRIANSF